MTNAQTAISAMHEVEKEIDDAVQESNGKMAEDHDNYVPEPGAQFVEVAQRIADAMIQAAELQVNEAAAVLARAQINLDRAKAEGEAVKADILVKAQEIVALNDKLAEYGRDQLRAHEKFHNGGE